MLTLPLCKFIMEGVKIRIGHDLGDDRTFKFTDTDVLFVMCNVRIKVLEARTLFTCVGWRRDREHGIHHKLA
jgi:hypothetical protein